MHFSARPSIPPSGWPYLESRAALKVEAALRPSRLSTERPSALSSFDLPLELRPGPRAERRRRPLAAFLRLLLALFLGVHFVYILSTSLLILSYRHVEPSVTVLMAYRAWVDGWKLERPRHVALKAVPSYVRRMLISVEDGNFYEHHGVEIAAIKRAYEINQRLKRPLYGGSTLSMQVARTLFLVPEKSYARKYFELIATLELELFLPKDRILELYFNYAEWGRGIFGIEAAAHHYYGRGVAKLSREEAAKLIALLSSPIRYKPSNMERKAILRERYYYLIGRYVSAPPSTAMPTQAAADAAAQASEAASQGAAPAAPTSADAEAPSDSGNSPDSAAPATPVTPVTPAAQPEALAAPVAAASAP